MSIALGLFSDVEHTVPLVRAAAASEKPAHGSGKPANDVSDDEDDLYAAAPRRPHASEGSALLSRVIAPSGPAGAWQWLPIVDPTGTLRIHLLPTMQVVFEALGATTFPGVLEDGEGEPASDKIDADDLELDRVWVGTVGRRRARTHLVVLLKNGALAIYEAVASISAASGGRRRWEDGARPGSLGVRFVKTFSRRLAVPVVRRSKKQTNGAEAALPPPRREFVPFGDLDGYRGVFVTGEDAGWIVADDHGPARFHDAADRGVYGFSELRDPDEGARHRYLLHARAVRHSSLVCV